VATLTFAPPQSTGHPTASGPKPSPASANAGTRADRYAQTLIMTLLFAAPAILCLHAGAVADPDIWWHMRVGELILQNHHILRTEPFSRGFAGTPWVVYSWLFELLMFKIYQWFGLMGILGYSTGMILAITAAMYHMVRRLQADFIVSVLLTYAACYSFCHLYTPRPWMFSILFFILELDILMQARKTGRLRGLLWLPVIFALWANIHIEFIYGLFLTGMVFLESLAANRRNGARDSLPVVPAACALVGSGLATLANPFGWRIYQVIYDLVTQGGGLKQVSEMQAIPFRDLPDYCVLALALASVAALAWSRRFRIFESGVLLFAIVMSFREIRDIWLLCAVAAAVLASAIPARKDSKVVRLPRFALALAILGAIGILLLAPRVLKVDNAKLLSQVINTMPVHAVEAVREKGYPGPLFNEFDWGGYLIWSLRQPVAIDGRTNLYGNDGMDRSITTWNGLPNWATDPQLKSARLIIGHVNSPLTQLLRLDSNYQLVYEDKIAAVFVVRN